jgi:hypothetical protein
MITDNNIVYHNRTSPSDDESSDGSSDGSLMAVYRKTKESEMGEEDKKFFTSLPTCYDLFLAFNCRDVSERFCPFAKHNEGWQKNEFIGNNAFWVYMLELAIQS